VKVILFSLGFFKVLKASQTIYLRGKAEDQIQMWLLRALINRNLWHKPQDKKITKIQNEKKVCFLILKLILQRLTFCFKRLRKQFKLLLLLTLTYLVWIWIVAKTIQKVLKEKSAIIKFWWVNDGDVKYVK
jgi:hypothetical protein